MKKLLALFALCAIALCSCERSNDDQTQGSDLMLTITSDQYMKFTEDGGEGIIEFSLTEAEGTRTEDTPTVEATCDAEWIKINGTVDNRISFNVDPNTGAERMATIHIEYLSQSELVVISQAGGTAVSTTFTATYLGGTYYGRFLGDRGYNFFVILSDMQPESVYTKPYAATEYRFDLYSGESSAFNYTHRIPVGTYTIDHARSGDPYTIDGYRDCSYLLTGNNTSTPYLDATLVVDEDSIIAEIKFMDGSVHRVEYHGSPVLGDYTEPTYADISPVSQYTSDINFDVKEGTISAYYRGDWFGIGHDNWFLHMIEDKNGGFNGVYLIFDFLVPKSLGGFDNKEGFVGEYTIFSEHPESYDYTIPEGRLRDDSQQLHAWYLYCVNGQVDMSKAAPMKGGSVKVEKSENGYLLTIDSIDDKGNKIQGTFEAAVSDYDNQSVE
ncbi:MAG: BACON domain-containing protein [Alistipes sp.]|nr:BACON domain-containing protein [Alistipes sp.]